MLYKDKSRAYSRTHVVGIDRPPLKVDGGSCYMYVIFGNHRAAEDHICTVSCHGQWAIFCQRSSNNSCKRMAFITRPHHHIIHCPNAKDLDEKMLNS